MKSLRTGITKLLNFLAGVSFIIMRNLSPTCSHGWLFSGPHSYPVTGSI